jgi:hypothetical protein
MPAVLGSQSVDLPTEQLAGYYIGGGEMQVFDSEPVA